jgi:hypothetical protein
VARVHQVPDDDRAHAAEADESDPHARTSSLHRVSSWELADAQRRGAPVEPRATSRGWSEIGAAGVSAPSIILSTGSAATRPIPAVGVRMVVSGSERVSSRPSTAVACLAGGDASL